MSRTADRPLASLSLDLDNDWSYRRTRGLAGWEEHPSYFSVVAPRALALLAELGLSITFFVVGTDAAGPDAHWVRELHQAGHEVGNHSHTHRPWMDRDPLDRLEREVADAEDAIAAATGVRPTAYRGPGYSCSPDLLTVLCGRGYVVDASTLPTWIGPVARAAYFRAARFGPEDKALRADLFGHLADARRPLHPYRFVDGAAQLVELPVSTLPLGRVPIHFSYLLTLAAVDERIATAYWEAALRLALLRRLEPSLLLHPLDLVDGTEIPELAFFPGMGMPWAVKHRLLSRWIGRLQERFDVRTVGEHARAVSLRPLPCHPFAAAAATHGPRGRRTPLPTAGSSGQPAGSVSPPG